MLTEPNRDLLQRAGVLLAAGRHAEAAPLLEEVVKELRRVRAETPPREPPEIAAVPDVIEESGLGDRLPTIRLELPSADPREARDREYATILQHLAICYMELGRWLDARALLDEGIQIAPIPELRGALLHELAVLCQRQGDLEAAIQHCRHAVDLELQGEREPFIALQTLAILYQLTKRFTEARELLELVQESCESRLDLERLASALRELGRAAFLGGEVDVAASFFAKAGRLEWLTGNRAGLQMSGVCLASCVAASPKLKEHPDIRDFVTILGAKP